MLDEAKCLPLQGEGGKIAGRGYENKTAYPLFFGASKPISFISI